jgi:hypothetical protein
MKDNEERDAVSSYKPKRIRFCQETNSAGRRCEHKVKGHPQQDGRKLHKRDNMTWVEPRGHAASKAIFDEAMAFFDATTARGSHKVEYPLGTARRVYLDGLDISDMVTGVTFPRDFHAVPTASDKLAAWWRERAEQEIGQTVDKAVEYSSTDLADIGHQLARTAGRTVSDEEAAELGVFFYVTGKLSRWAGAVAQGRRPSDDTLFDMGVYVRMAQRIRESGSWPGIEL